MGGGGEGGYSLIKVTGEPPEIFLTFEHFLLKDFLKVLS